eukprot:5686314-Prymnesium_polylepis.2
MTVASAASTSSWALSVCSSRDASVNLAATQTLFPFQHRLIRFTATVVPIQLTKHGELTDLEASKDFAVLNTTCYVLEVWNRPTDRREACNAYGQRGHCSNEGDNSKQDVCYDDFVYLFAYDNPSGNQSKVDINRTKITQTSVNCNQDG